MKKRWIVICSFLLLLFCTACKVQAVFAKEALKVSLDQYDTDKAELQLYVNRNQDDFQPSKEKSSLLVGKQKLDVKSIRTLKKTKQPVSYLLLTDVSGSMDQERVEQAKESMKQFVDQMGKGDTICVTTMGNNLESSGFLKTKQKLHAFIDKIQVTNEDTNLYHSIRELLDLLKTEKAVNQKRCIVIFSDGADDQTVGITREEAETTVKESHIPIFTVGLLKQNPSEAEIESAKVLGSFARYSAGGEHFVPVLDHYAVTDIMGKVQKRIQNSLVVSADISDIIVGDETVYLEIKLSDGTQKAEDGMTVPAGKIAKAVKEAKEQKAKEQKAKEKDKEPEQQKAPVSKTETKKKNNIGIWIAAVLAGLALIGLAVLLLRRRYTQEMSTGQDVELEDIDISGIQENTVTPDRAGHTIGPDSERSVDLTQPGMEEQAVTFGGGEESSGRPSRSKIILFQVGPGRDKRYELSVKREVKIGREHSCQLCVKDDTALSGVHCLISNKNGNIYIKDLESTNGTYVNGVPVVGEFQLHKDDIILIGSYEYRVYWD